MFFELVVFFLDFVRTRARILSGGRGADGRLRVLGDLARADDLDEGIVFEVADKKRLLAI